MPPEWKVAIAMLCFAGLFASGFFDTLYIQVLGKQEVDRAIRIAVAVIIALFLLVMGLAAYSRGVPREYRRRQRPFFEWPMKFLLYLTPLWLAVGIVNGWEITYVAGDLFLILVMPATYFILVRRPLHDPKQVFNWLYGMMLLMAILSSALVFYHNLISGYKHKMSVDAAVLPTLYIMLKSSPSVIELLMVPFFLIAAVLTTKRGTWAALIVMISFALLARPGVKRPLRIALILLMIGGIYFVVEDERPDWILHTQTLVGARIKETQEDLGGEKGDLSSSSGGRMGEIFGVYDTIVERRSPLDWVTGLGLGAVVQARGGRLRHHVHSTPATFLARTGIIGLTLWLISTFAVLFFLVRYWRRCQKEWFRVQLLFWMGLWMSGMILSIKAQAYWGSAIGGLQVAYIYHLCRASEAAGGPAKTKRTVIRRRPPLSRRPPARQLTQSVPT
jgi:hypothetical protein